MTLHLSPVHSSDPPRQPTDTTSMLPQAVPGLEVAETEPTADLRVLQVLGLYVSPEVLLAPHKPAGQTAPQAPSLRHHALRRHVQQPV